MMNPLTIGDANGSSSHMNNLMVLYYLVYALDKKECSLTLHSTSSPTKKPLEWTVAAKDIYSQYNIKAHNQSHATIQKKKRRFALSTHQIFFVSLQALKACIQPPKLLSSNRTNGTGFDDHLVSPSEPSFYVIGIFSIFVMIFVVLLSFSYAHNHQEFIENPDGRFIKEWLTRNNDDSVRSTKRKRRRSKMSFASLMSGGEDDMMLVNRYNKFKTSWDRFSFLQVRTSRKLKKSSSTVKRKKNKSNNPSIYKAEPGLTKAVSELPVIRIDSYERSEAYMSTDSNKTF